MEDEPRYVTSSPPPSLDQELDDLADELAEVSQMIRNRNRAEMGSVSDLHRLLTAELRRTIKGSTRVLGVLLYEDYATWPSRN